MAQTMCPFQWCGTTSLYQLIVSSQVLFINRMLTFAAGHNISWYSSESPNQGTFDCLFLLRFIFVSTYVYVAYATYVLVPTETRRKHQISQNWSYRPLWVTQYRCWELNAGSLEKQHIFLITVKSLQLFRFFPESLSVHHTSWMVLEAGVICFPIHLLLYTWY